MSWYSQQQGPLDTEHDSLVVAFANLLQRFDIQIDPANLLNMLTPDDPMVDWWSVAEYVDNIDMGEVDQNGGWPPHNNAIVRLRRIDEKQAGVVDHYCLVADQRVGSIIDSLDGKIKAAGVYGQPSGWASYVLYEDEEPEEIEEVEQPKPGTTYKVLRGGESVWDIARKLKVDGMSGKDLADHNSVDPHQKVPEGTVLHLPIALPEKEPEKQVEFEFMDEPMLMHVAKPGGTTKFAFGHVKKWTDIKPASKKYQQNTNVEVVATALVPIHEDGSTAKYYMEATDIDPETEKVRWMTGFNHSHLVEGAVEAVKPAPKPELSNQLSIVEKALEEAQKEPEQLPEPEIDLAMQRNPDDQWKTSIMPLYTDKRAVSYIFNEDVEVHELAGVRGPKTIKAERGAQICCTIWKDGVEYALPTLHETTGLLFGIPMDKLRLEDDDFDFVSIKAEAKAERIGAGHLTQIEQYWYVPLARVSAKYTKLKTMLNKQKIKEKK